MKKIYKCYLCGRTNEKFIVFSDKCKSGKEICQKHYRQLEQHGKPLERSPYDKNEIIVLATHAEIILYNRKQVERARTKIDLEDVEKCKKYRWSMANGYVYTRIKGKTLKLHRFLLNVEQHKQVDHRRHDKLDNRKFNLRICTNRQNQMNRLKEKGRKLTSKFKVLVISKEEIFGDQQ